jgi:serpin B
VTEHAHLAFTLALHRATAPDPDQNACWSPFSVASALGLVAQGARGMTRDELVVLLLGDKAGDVAALGALLGRAGRLERARADQDEPVLAVANTLWTDASIEVRDTFAAELARWASGSVRQAPMRTAPLEARNAINADVARTTRGLIPELLPDGVIRDDTVSALVNALYLRCAWVIPFTQGATVPRPFHAPGGTVEVPTMDLPDSAGYHAMAGWQVISLPAVGGVQAVVLLPDGDLAAAESDLEADTLAGMLNAPPTTQVGLRLPTLNVSMRAELTPALNQLGVRTAFRNDADLSGISTTDLAVQAVLHEAVLKLDEQGMEGAAATAVMFRTVSLLVPEPVTVHVDRPFLLVIRHPQTGMVYFMARIADPS